ncbi:protein phosphatase [Motilibacter rhizosphaerae]|uniref:Serine/threonine protein phosphatase PstP n=1 Tax=Motilibacter rhizosphaerae TaxID=598652 RepID=A0A4Q7NVN8_9ACTN|nr:Stp1/IreP family PP2C-type Ser/Thr phosphatase [Motilibacter rhizosphaerae]RZS91257.1 protein phosphatase [Motilibacter rhizosphaerae]
MATALRYAARSDVGLLRDGNEDSGYAGPRLLVVADGMGGHVAGEVASSVAVATMSALDEDAPGSDLLGLLRGAVDQANEQIAAIVLGDPSLVGMGTTLTALLRAGSRLAVVHIGDSRAYLLRDGAFDQITHDHTFVQTLVDEGRITREEADSHPQRSLITRALMGHDEVDPDLSVREARAGDRYLLCSDGLSSVVSHDTLADVLASVPDPDAACRALVQYALRGGGPDNITVIVADVVDTDASPSQVPQVVGAVAEDRVARRGDGPSGSSAGRAAALRPARADEEEDDEPPRGRPSRWPLVVLVALLLALAGGSWAAWSWSQRQYYVGTSQGQVAIYRGLPQSLAGLSLSRVVSREGIALGDLPAYTRDQLADGITVDSLADAHQRIGALAQQVAQCKTDPTSPACREELPDSGTTGSPAPTAGAVAPSGASAAAVPTPRGTATASAAPRSTPATLRATARATARSTARATAARR